MKPSVSIMKFLNSSEHCTSPESSYPKVTVSEIKELKESCTHEEYLELAAQACSIMGVELEVAT